MSVLNGSFSIGGRLKGSEYFGSVYWDGTDPREMTMVDIPPLRGCQTGRHGTVGLFTAVPARLFHRYGSLRERIAGRNIPCDKDTARREDERTVRRAAREIHRLRRARNPRGRTLLRCRQKKEITKGYAQNSGIRTHIHRIGVAAGVLFDNLTVSPYLYPLVYAGCIILLPANIDRALLLILSFALGLSGRSPVGHGRPQHHSRHGYGIPCALHCSA